MENIVEEDVDWKEECKNLLEDLDQSEDSDESDYRQVTDHPMDLKTVGEKLQVGHYATPSEFAKDVRLIFEKLKKCNPIRKLSETIELSILFEDNIRHILDSYKRRKVAVKSKFKIDKW